MFDLNDLHAAARRESAPSRRLFLAYAAALPMLPALGARALGRTVRSPKFKADPFSLGVASGDPTPRGFVLWTRLAPEPLEPGGGLAPEAIEVGWEIADDEGMTKVVRKGTAVATPQLGHSVHVEADGLEPGRWYWYRFTAGDARSAVGRTRTAPPLDAEPVALRFAFASCQHYETGHYTAYEHMLRDDLDLVFHLGDYIYEGGPTEGKVRKHSGSGEIRSLEDYRIRYAQYRSDPHLRAMHQRCPWVVTWDDHEFDNNYASGISEEKNADPAAFLERRANAYQAYYEMMPLRRAQLPQGPDLRLYRTVGFGRLATFQVLDTRQYRGDQPNDDRRSPLNAAALDKTRSILGARQSGWLRASLLSSPATWNVLAQQVMMGMVGFKAGEGEPAYSMDQWPGYAHERMKLVEFLRDRKVLNPVVLTGDIHSNWVNDLRVDDREPETAVVASEFVGTSISSGGNGTADASGLRARMVGHDCVKFFNAQRGYVRCTVTPDAWRSDYQVVENVSSPGGPVVTKGAFVVEAGKAGVQPA